MNDQRFVLVHSPLTGPSFWSGVRDALWAQRRPAYLARLPASLHIHPPYWLTHAAGVAAGLPEDGSVVLVGHSGAGPLLPAIGRLARNRSAAARVAGYLFVDCDLPRDRCSRLDLFDDPADAERLRQRSREGWMPRWTGEQLAEWLPDPAARQHFIDELPLTPLALYEEAINVPDGWPDAPCGYLKLSEAYPGAVRSAESAGWPVRRLDAHHFAPLTHAAVVAGTLAALADALTKAAAPPRGRCAG